MAIQTHDTHKLLKFLLKKSGGDMDAAKEAGQEAYLSAIKSYHTFRHKSTFFTWLCRIALNKLADYYRKQLNRNSKVIVPTVEVFNNIFDPSLSEEEKYSLEELKINMNKCLMQVPYKYRKLLKLKYYEELSNAQISLKLSLPLRSLEGKLYRAKKLLAKIYKKSFPDST